MNPRKGLMGLLSTVFLLSAITMVMLMIDDRKDLSSRAGSWLSNSLRPALPGVAQAENEAFWDGAQYKLPITVKFNGVLWMPPKDRNIVFYHRNLPITIRITSGEVNQISLRQILGENFTSLKLISKVSQGISGWSVTSYTAYFLGDMKSIDVWYGKEDISLISVRPTNSSGMDIEDFARSIVSTSAVGQVKGLSTQDDSARLATLIRPSVVMVMNNFCSKVKFTNIDGFVLSGREYPFCIASVGSGFFINKNGYLATNGHVVQNVPKTSLFYAVTSGSLDNLLTDYMQVYMAQKTGTLPSREDMTLRIKEAHASKENIYQMAAMVYDLNEKNFLSIGDSVNNYYVQLGNTPLQLTTTGVSTSQEVVEAKLIDSDYKEPEESTGFTTSDVAILKVDGTNYPGLPLGSIDDLSVGSSIEVIGFPGIVMGSNSFLLDTSANAEPTFTKGIVSSFKLAKGNKKRLIQTDASINHGNSGGPAISSEGKVVGLATYGLTPEEGSGNYNFLRDIQDLKALMEKNNITNDVGDTYLSWKNGLENFWLSYFKYAKRDFETVSTLYPVHPSVSKYLTVAKTKINTPEDQTPKFTRAERSLYMNISVGVMALSALSFVVLWFFDRAEMRKKAAYFSSTLEKPI